MSMKFWKSSFIMPYREKTPIRLPTNFWSGSVHWRQFWMLPPMSPTVLGAVVGFCLGTMGPLALTAALSFASGAMLYVVFGELLPEAAELWRSRLPALAAVVGMVVGLGITRG